MTRRRAVHPKPWERAGVVWNQQTGQDRAYDVSLSIDDEDVADNKGPIIASFTRRMEAQVCALRINEATRHAMNAMALEGIKCAALLYAERHENRRLRALLRFVRRRINCGCAEMEASGCCDDCHEARERIDAALARRKGGKK